MLEGFMSEIRLFASDAVPENWMPCNGQLVNISDNQALFALLYTTYGGDGKTTFALPDLRGKIPIHPTHGQHPGQSVRATSDQALAKQHQFTIDTEEQPHLALSFCICVRGIFPTRP